MKSLHEGLVTQVTSIWAPSALWKMDRSQNCGWTRQGYLLVLKCLNDGPGKDVSWLVFWNVWIQVKELYQQKTNKANLPDYIEDFSNPNREEHFDSIIKLRSKVFSLCPCRFLNIKHNIIIGFGNVKPIKDIYLVLCLKTLPKAQRTQGLSAYQSSNKFKHKSWSNFIIRISTKH